MKTNQIQHRWNWLTRNPLKGIYEFGLSMTGQQFVSAKLYKWMQAGDLDGTKPGKQRGLWLVLQILSASQPHDPLSYQTNIG